MNELFRIPEKIFTADGRKRRVGFEIEFGGVELADVNRILVEIFSGRVERENDYSFKVKTVLGDFTVEADSNFLLHSGPEKILKSFGLDPGKSGLGANLEGVIESIAEIVVPFEIATPPLPIDDLACVETIRARLHDASATGTRAAPWTAFGMQFNPEVPALTAPVILSYLRSFFLFYDWLYEETDIPLARKVAPFIHPFDGEYQDLVLAPGYEPDLKGLMRDYLEHNPTRNRPLDLLPLFAHIDRDLVFSFPVEAELVKPRPTFHYRLPNSRVDDPSWTIASDWNKWVEVENLAADHDRLNRMRRDYFRTREEAPVFTRSKWIEKTRGWIAP